ncbi:MAG: redoxin domain-containing protein [Alphaproteobacteria bacterium]|nr:redoxin domain-containing protein [Alphaproteobacteria bacterium]
MTLLLLLACTEPTMPVGSDAPDFTLPDAQGNPVSLHDFSGDVILLDLSAFW